MSNDPQREENLADELRNLGQNLVAALQAAWETPERKRLSDEMVNGLNEFGSTVRREVEQFSSSSTGQKLRNEVDQVSEKIRTSEAQNRVRDELLNALKNANHELQKVIDRWSETEKAKPAEAEQKPDEPASKG
jgi:hypothetical protein